MEAQPRNCLVCDTSKFKLTKVFGNFEDTHLCSRCRNGHYRSAKVFFSKIIHNFDYSTLSQDQFNDFTFSYLNEPSNCKLRKDLSDFEQICVMVTDYSTAKQCQFCRFRRTFFIFKIPALALFTEKKNDNFGTDCQKNLGWKFRDAIEKLWNPMLEFIGGKIANVQYKHDMQKSKIRVRQAKRKYQNLKSEVADDELPENAIYSKIQTVDSQFLQSPFLQSKSLQIQPLQIPASRSQPLQSQLSKTQLLQIEPMQTHSLQNDVVSLMLKEASSFSFLPHFKLVQTYCENLKEEDEYYIFFNNVHPSIKNKLKKVEKHVVKKEEGCGIDHEISSTSPKLSRFENFLWIWTPNCVQTMFFFRFKSVHSEIFKSDRSLNQLSNS